MIKKLIISSAIILCLSSGAFAQVVNPGVPGGINGEVQYNNGGAFGGLTPDELTADINVATTTLSGAIPAWPNNITTYFRGDGTYATLPIGSQSQAGILECDGVTIACVSGKMVGPIVNVLAYAACDGVHDDNAGIVSAIAAVSTSGGAVQFPGNKTCLTSATIELPQLVYFIGGGKSSSYLEPVSNSISAIVEITGGYTGIRDMCICNSGSLSQLGIYIHKTFNNLPIDIIYNAISGFGAGNGAGIYIDLGDNIGADYNWFLNDTVAIQNADYGVNAHYNFNSIQGGFGFVFNMVTQGAEGVEIGGNHILPAVANSECMYISAADWFSIHDNLCDQVKGTAGILIDGLHSINNIVMRSNYWGYVGPSGTGTPAGIFIFAESTAFGINNLIDDDDTFAGWTQAGIYSLGNTTVGNTNIRISKPIFYSAAQNARDIQLDYTTNCSIDNPIFTGAASLVADTGASCKVDNGIWNTGPVGSGLGTMLFGMQISGYAPFNPIWTSFNPTPTCNSISATVNYAKYQQTGKTVSVVIDFTCSVLSGTGIVNFTGPGTPSGSGVLVGREELITGLMGAATIGGGSANADIVGAAGTTTWPQGSRFILQGTYEVQ